MRFFSTVIQPRAPRLCRIEHEQQRGHEQEGVERGEDDDVEEHLEEGAEDVRGGEYHRQNAQEGRGDPEEHLQPCSGWDSVRTELFLGKFGSRKAVVVISRVGSLECLSCHLRVVQVVLSVL